MTEPEKTPPFNLIKEGDYQPSPHQNHVHMAPGHGVGYTPPRPYAAPGPPPWETPKKKRRIEAWLAVFAAVIGTIVLCSLVAWAVAEDVPLVVNTAPPAATSEPAPAPGTGKQEGARKVGEKFLCGDFEYTVHGVKEGILKLGGQFNEMRAQGQFVRVEVSVTNTASEPKTFGSSLLLKVEDPDGRVFGSDENANTVGNDGETGLFAEVNPGNTIKVFAYFDLPRDAQAQRLLISEGLFSFSPDAVVALR